MAIKVNFQTTCRDMSFGSAKGMLNQENIMNKKIWLTLGIAGMLLANPSVDAQAKVDVRVGINLGNSRTHHYHRKHWNKRNRHNDAKKRPHDIKHRKSASRR